MNIIFDLGGVVLKWDPGKLLNQFFPDTFIQEKLRTSVFGHPDWNDFDRGVLEKEILVQRIVERTGVDIAQIQEFLYTLILSLEPVPEIVKLLYKLKNEGHNLFCLSNINYPTLANVENSCTFWDVFAGCVFSCKVKMVKPEAGIYRYLLDQYYLDPRDCLFIDDLEANLSAAGKMGITTVLFKNPVDCEKQIAQVVSGIPVD